MKKLVLSLSLLTAGSALFYSCKTNTDNTEGMYTKEQADSMAQAKLDSLMAAEKYLADSLLEAEAQRKADSLAAVTGKPAEATVTKKATAKSNKTTTSTKTNTQPKPDTKPAPDNRVEENKVPTRPGSKNTTPTDVTDRPGVKNSETPKSVSDRPGAK